MLRDILLDWILLTFWEIFYYFIISFILLFIGVVTSNIQFIIIGAIALNVIREYTKGFHCPTLNGCINNTSVLFLIFSYLSLELQNYWNIMFVLSLYIFKNICIYAPIPIDTESSKDESQIKKYQSKYLSL